jgi:hypothetical protein
MSSTTQPTGESSTSDILFAAAVVVLCVLALALSIHAFRGRGFHHAHIAMSVECPEIPGPASIAKV